MTIDYWARVLVVHAKYSFAGALESQTMKQEETETWQIIFCFRIPEVSIMTLGIRNTVDDDQAC